MHGSLQLLDQHCAKAAGWLVGGRMTQADVTGVTAYTFLHEALGFDATLYPALHAHAHHCETLPAFADTHVAFFKPQPAT